MDEVGIVGVIHGDDEVKVEEVGKGYGTGTVCE